jgi:hypothetical protein
VGLLPWTVTLARYKACVPLGFEKARPKGVRERAVAIENLESAADSEWEKGHY